ncbi:unnamed protein product, partial [Amoebophrya sp. A25]
ILASSTVVVVAVLMCTIKTESSVLSCFTVAVEIKDDLDLRLCFMYVVSTRTTECKKRKSCSE